MATIKVLRTDLYLAPPPPPPPSKRVTCDQSGDWKNRPGRPVPIPNVHFCSVCLPVRRFSNTPQKPFCEENPTRKKKGFQSGRGQARPV